LASAGGELGVIDKKLHFIGQGLRINFERKGTIGPVGFKQLKKRCQQSSKLSEVLAGMITSFIRIDAYNASPLAM
jgi:hypothetical protein